MLTFILNQHLLEFFQNQLINECAKNKKKLKSCNFGKTKMEFFQKDVKKFTFLIISIRLSMFIQNDK